jgi:hypothetical protein
MIPNGPGNPPGRRLAAIRIGAQEQEGEGYPEVHEHNRATRYSNYKFSLTLRTGPRSILSGDTMLLTGTQQRGCSGPWQQGPGREILTADAVDFFTAKDAQWHEPTGQHRSGASATA